MLYRLSQNKFIPKLLIIAMLYISGLSTVNAAVITSTDLVAQQQEQVARNQLRLSTEVLSEGNLAVPDPPDRS